MRRAVMLWLGVTGAALEGGGDAHEPCLTDGGLLPVDPRSWRCGAAVPFTPPPGTASDWPRPSQRREGAPA